MTILQVITAIATGALGALVVVVSLVAWLTGMRKDVDRVAGAIDEHKDNCGERYAALAVSFGKVEETIETHRRETRSDISGLHGKLDEVTRLLLIQGRPH